MQKGQPTKKEVYNLSRSKVIKEMTAEIPANHDLRSAVFALQVNAEYKRRTGKTGETVYSIAHAIQRARADAAKKAAQG